MSFLGQISFDFELLVAITGQVNQKMAPSRTSKSVYKRSTREPSPERDLRNSSKTKPRVSHFNVSETERVFKPSV